MIPTRRDPLIGSLALIVAPAAVAASSTSPSSTSPTPGVSESYSAVQADLDGWFQTLDFGQVSDPLANAHFDHLRTLVTRAQNLCNMGAPIPFGAETDPFAGLRDVQDLAGILPPASAAPFFTLAVPDPLTDAPASSASGGASPSPTAADPLAEVYAEFAAEPVEENPTFWELVEDFVKFLLGGLSFRTFIEIMDEHFPVIWENFLVALKNVKGPGGKSRLARALGALLSIMGRNSQFWNLLIGKIGAAAVGKIAARVFARFLPLIGWALFIAELLLMIYNHFNKKGRKKAAQRASPTTVAFLSPSSPFGASYGPPALGLT